MTSIERAWKWGEERDQPWLQKGIEQGIERERRLVHRLVSRRFGPATADRLLPMLARISDQEDIVAVADAVVECKTAADFLRRVQ